MSQRKQCREAKKAKDGKFKNNNNNNNKDNPYKKQNNDFKCRIAALEAMLANENSDDEPPPKVTGETDMTRKGRRRK